MKFTIFIEFFEKNLLNSEKLCTFDLTTKTGKRNIEVTV